MLDISTHALREEGDAASFASRFCTFWLFLPTPSARRATLTAGTKRQATAISTHALREEGDANTGIATEYYIHFYPRPPRGGRLDDFYMIFRTKKISTHALREEGDASFPAPSGTWRYFYPRPPRGGRPLSEYDKGQAN